MKPFGFPTAIEAINSYRGIGTLLNLNSAVAMKSNLRVIDAESVKAFESLKMAHPSDFWPNNGKAEIA